MGIKSIFGKTAPSADEEYIEIEPETDLSNGKVLIRIEKLEDYADSDRIQKKLREGNVLFIKIKDLKDKDMSELKRAIDRIRKTCLAINGDIAGVSDDWLLVCPASAKIYREDFGEKKTEERPLPRPVSRPAEPASSPRPMGRMPTDGPSFRPLK